MATYKLVNADQLDSDLTAVGNAIRSKGGTSAGLSFPAGMVSAIGAISTGVELNFDVVPGLTQPGTAVENTIWVKTEKIGAWYFSATQPEGMVDYDVWFPVGTSSTVEFNALKKNGIQVYPISAKQYVSGAWADVTAKSYQGGVWVDWWNGELFINGNQYEGFTGGWVRADYYKGSDDNTDAGTLTVGDTIYLKTSSGTYCKSVRTTNKIDLTNWKTLKYTVTQYNKGEAAILVTSQVGDVDNVSVAIGNFAVGENSLDIKELTGEYYIGAYVRNAGSVTIEKIYLEA